MMNDLLPNYGLTLIDAFSMFDEWGADGEKQIGKEGGREDDEEGKDGDDKGDEEKGGADSAKDKGESQEKQGKSKNGDGKEVVTDGKKKKRKNKNKEDTPEEDSYDPELKGGKRGPTMLQSGIRATAAVLKGASDKATAIQNSAIAAKKRLEASEATVSYNRLLNHTHITIEAFEQILICMKIDLGPLDDMEYETKLKEKFQRYDKDKSGSINFREMRRAWIDLMGPEAVAKELENMGKEPTKGMFEAYRNKLNKLVLSMAQEAQDKQVQKSHTYSYVQRLTY